MKKSTAKSSTNSKVIRRVKSSTRKNMKHTISMKKGKKVCSCEGFRYQGHCKHLPGVENPKITIQKLAAPKGKTTRVAVISLLLKHLGKPVNKKLILEAASKLKGTKVSEKKLEKRIPEVAHYAKTRGLFLVKSNNFLQFKKGKVA